jgi:6-phosphogluconolactonase
MATDLTTVVVMTSPAALAERAMLELAQAGERAVAERGRFWLALAGGRTPLLLYERLAKAGPTDPRPPWANTFIFWSDERHVPPGHTDSNYRLAHEVMLAHLPIRAAQIHRIEGEQTDARRGADAYEQLIRGLVPSDAQGTPRFDVILLGLGPDGHTASIFPASPALEDSMRLVMACWVASRQVWRITFTPRLINAARQVIFLVAGEDKAPALKATLEGEYDPLTYPAQAIKPTDGSVLWIVDRAAASLLETPRTRRNPA